MARKRESSSLVIAPLLGRNLSLRRETSPGCDSDTVAAVSTAGTIVHLGLLAQARAAAASAGCRAVAHRAFQRPTMNLRTVADRRRAGRNGVKLPAGVGPAVRGPLVPAHAIGEGDLEQVVITCGKPLEDVGQRVAFVAGQVRQRCDRAPGQYHRLRTARRPEGRQRGPRSILTHTRSLAWSSSARYSSSRLLRGLRSRRPVSGVPSPARWGCSRWPKSGRGDVVARAHHRAPVLEDLHIVDEVERASSVVWPAQASTTRRSSSRSSPAGVEVVGGREAEDAAQALDGLRRKQPAGIHSPCHFGGEQRGKSLSRRRYARTGGLLAPPARLLPGAEVAGRIVGGRVSGGSFSTWPCQGRLVRWGDTSTHSRSARCTCVNVIGKVEGFHIQLIRGIVMRVCAIISHGAAARALTLAAPPMII